jgi:hypothetical protein
MRSDFAIIVKKFQRCVKRLTGDDRLRNSVELVLATRGRLSIRRLGESVMLRDCNLMGRSRALKSAACKCPFSTMFFLVLIMGMLHTSAYAQDCLFLNNERVNLRQSVVYENGRLKLRIDGWSSPAEAKGTVDIKSNAPSFNQKIATDVSGSRHFFIKKDTSLCYGTEITANCESTYDTWRCLFSEF